MAFTASHRFARISPRKVRLMADIVRGKLADEALELLRYQPQRGARMLEKVIKSALANAEDQRAQNINTLVLTDVQLVARHIEFQRGGRRAAPFVCGEPRRNRRVLDSADDSRGFWP